MQSAFVHARTQGQVQPLSSTLIDGTARHGPPRRLWLRTGLGSGLLDQHHMAIDCGRLKLRRAALSAFCPCLGS